MSGTVSMDDDIVGVGRPLPRLAAAMIVDDRRVRLTWRDGNSVTVDLSPLLLSHRHFIPLRDNDDLFQTLRINEEGTALEWDDGIELSALWISRLPEVGMQNAEFRAIMEKLHYSLDGMASALDISRRLVAMYRGVAPIPAHIALSARYLAERAEKKQAS
jgi:hypothetical protein